MNHQKTYIIAEAGVNHNGNLDIALQLVDVAVEAGANAIKFQTFCADQLVTSWASKAEYQKKSTDNSESQYTMLKKLELSHKDHFVLKLYCEKNKIDFLSTPFDSVSADFLLNQLKLRTIKIASGEIATAPLLLQIAKSDADIILSTGMSTVGEIELALAVIALGYAGGEEKPTLESIMRAYYSHEAQEKLKKKVTLLHCTSDYPADFNHINLRAMDTLKSAFDLPIGYSDHSEGISVSIAAVALGARIIEKHFTLDRSLPGPDHKASLEPGELKNMVKSIREAELSLGNNLKIPTQKELETKMIARKSLISTQSIRAGETFTKINIDVRRPGYGISAMRYWEYLDKVATRNYEPNELIYD